MVETPAAAGHGFSRTVFSRTRLWPDWPAQRRVSWEVSWEGTVLVGQAKETLERWKFRAGRGLSLQAKSGPGSPPSVCVLALNEWR